MKMKIRVLLLLSVYAVVMLLPWLPDRLILFPSTERINAEGATRLAIPFNGGDLEVWRGVSRSAQAAGEAEFYLLRFYGNADRAERWVMAEAEMWNGRAVEVWGVNYPGYGGSTGPARLRTMGPAALAAFDTLKKEAGNRPIVVFGASLGTASALHLAAQRPVTGLILHNPPALRPMILAQGWWNLWLLAGPWAARVPAALESVTNAAAARAPALFLLAEKDEVVAPKYQALVFEAYAGEKRAISLTGAAHNSPLPLTAARQMQAELDWLLAGARK